MAFTTIVNDMDWAAASFLNEITGALREREQADGGAATTPVVSLGPPPDDVQAAALFASWQQACEDLIGIWVEPKSYHGEATIPLFTWTTVKTAAGIPSGFRRATTKPADWTDYNDAAYSYGQMQVGDIIGPWIWADLQAVLKQLVATRYLETGAELSTHAPADDYWTGFAIREISNCADIKARVEADWATDAAGSGCACRSHLDKSGDAWNGRLAKAKMGVEFTAGALWNGVSRACDWYVFPIDPGGADVNTFDANGETLVDSRWSLWNGAGSAEATVDPQSAYCPLADIDAPLPVWCDCPTINETRSKGFRSTPAVNAWICVVRWDVTGGFTYT